MALYQIIFVTAYLFVTICYFFSETSGDFPRRAINKIILATLFLVYGFVECFRLSDGSSAYFNIFLAALAFAWLGDVILLYDFVKGGAMFMIGNILFIVFEFKLMAVLGLVFADIWWFLILLLAFWGLFFICTQKKWIDLKNYKIVLLPYLFLVTMHGSIGLALAIVCPRLPVILLGVGLALFMVSDYFLMVHKFKRKTDAILRCNSGTYFIGLMLVVLSVSYFFK